MACICVVTPENAQGLKRLLYWYSLRQTQGYVGGIAKILLTDPQRAFPMLRLYAPSYVITAFTLPTRDDRVPLGCADSGYTAVQYSKKGIGMQCDRCGGEQMTKAGRDRQARQLSRCRACGRRRTTRAGSAFSGERFPDEVIALAVRHSLRYRRSYEDVTEWLAERGVSVDPSTVYDGVRTCTPWFVATARAQPAAVGKRVLLGYAELMTANVLKHVARRLIARCVQRSVARAAQAPASR